MLLTFGRTSLLCSYSSWFTHGRSTMSTKQELAEVLIFIAIRIGNLFIYYL
jgi:hypothetical protein